jgi:endonuclease/exonuclease/phosphatase family metal-dependent hydrolase
MSANLWSGAADPDGFAELVARLEIDVVAVQELKPEQAEALSDVMPHGSLFVGAQDGGVALALRRPAHVETVPMPYRHAHTTVLGPAEWPELDAPIHVTATHLMAPHSVTPMPSPFLRPRQLRAIEAYLRERPADQRVVMGDFNATPLWPAYRRIAAQLTDAAVAVAEATGTRPVRTWGPWPGSPRLLRIDHAFVAGLQVESFRTVHVPGSDHSAIVMDVAGGAGSEATGEVGPPERA